MNRILTRLVVGLSLILLALGVTSSASAAKLYKWVDEYGNVSYQDSPPPDEVEYEEKALRGAATEGGDYGELMQAASDSAPITLYSVAACDSCDLIRLHLDKQGVPYAEKDAAEDIEVQEELKAKTGALQVPTLSIGENVLTGYSKSSIDQALVDAGYPMGGETAEEQADSNEQADTSAQEQTNEQGVEIDFSAIDEEESSTQN